MTLTFKNAVKAQVFQRLRKAARLYKEKKGIALTVREVDGNPLDDNFSIEVGPETVAQEIKQFLASMNLPVDNNGQQTNQPQTPPAPAGTAPTPAAIAKQLRESIARFLKK